MPTISPLKKKQWDEIRQFKYQVISPRVNADEECPKEEYKALRKWMVNEWFVELKDEVAPEKALFFKNRMRMFIIKNCPYYKRRIYLGKGR